MKIYKNDLNTKTKEISESILFNGNGFIGVRNVFDEYEYDDYKTNRHTYINGFYDKYNIVYPEDYYGSAKVGEQMLPVIDGQTTYIYIGDEQFTLNTCTIKKHTRFIDMKNGQSIREIHFTTPKNKEIKLKISKITSFIKKEQFITKYEFEQINCNEKIKVVTKINFKNKSSGDKNDPRIGQHEGVIQILEIKDSQKSILCQSPQEKIKLYFKWHTNTKEQIELKDECIYITSILEDSNYIKAYTYSLEGFVDPIINFENIALEQKDYLDKFWEISKVKVKSDDNLQESVNYGIYALLQSTGTNNKTSISAKGLSGIGYEGHVFWDAEMYVFPLFVKTKPDIARSMIMYRVNMLANAYKNTQNIGYQKGVLYPWRTITGRESSAFFEAGMAQHHINLDIGYAMFLYLEMTGDTSIIKEGVFEVLLEISRFFIQIIHKKDGLYHLDKVTGPDEYNVLVNDNYYTNAMLKNHLEKFVKLCKNIDNKELLNYKNQYDLEEKEIDLFKEVAKNIYLPFDENLKILKQDQEFLDKGFWPYKDMKKPLLLNYHPLEIYRYQVSKQADVVLALQLLGQNIKDKNIVQNTINYYEKVTTHDSSLSFSSYATVYAKIKDKRAYPYFLKNSSLDLDDLHNNTKDGIHTASMGGTYQTLVEGFANMQIIDGEIKFENNLPANIKYLEFKVVFKNVIYEVRLEQNQEIKIKKKDYYERYI